ncbi:UDP-N-acetylmuramate--L-alanine ligase [Francisella halioticida]|uniref:UDP-N-acetylmuramate--L-alanine ligase n=1 Tax=Francisella halioticida TaxID=549298 RepID=A0ABN5ATV3_9GAMM|nr:UDP-N-acetylmuramate--L-alanine ligase [Francisella halioticida]ASG67109.1 UDP-N-acetylmuramate--L-alanine ligase [Francisella halioticida]BCD91948.1 UDP-N-acetylmuramate--L-alanine ligase [Francisella halioticida]
MNKKILFLGIGGIGVSALAIAARNLGAAVEGHDSKPSKLTAKLESLGIKIFITTNNINLSNYDMVVYSSAISAKNYLLQEAKTLGIECLQRAMFLAILMRNFNYSIAITGTHGKTTTSSILATLLCYLDKNNSFVVGGVVKYSNSNIEVNGKDKLVIEADESDASFLHLNPQCAVVTNVDLDHMTTYQNSYENLLDNFLQFLSKETVKDIYLCVDDKGCNDLLVRDSLTDKNIVLYGFSEDANAQIKNYRIVNNNHTCFKVCYKGEVLDFTIQLPGKYNVQNATACIVCCLDLGFEYQDIRRALLNVEGVARRFDLYAKKISGCEIQVIDDYGHHPVEVTNCLEAVRDRFPCKKIIHVFQPHRYTRNRDLFRDWLKALCLSDQLILLPTYSAGEEVILGAESKDIAQRLTDCILLDSFSSVVTTLKKIIDKDSVVLVQGAGDVTNLVEMLGE